MQTEKLILDHCSQRDEVEEFSKALPYVGISIFTATLIVKAINLSDLSWLMVASQKGDSISISDFQGDEQSDCLNTVMT